MNDSVRFGPRPRFTAGAGASWLVGLFAGAVFLRGLIRASFPVAVSVAGLLLLAAWAVLWWRYRQQGVYVDPGTIRVSRVLRTDTVPLTEVSAVDAMPSKPAGVRRLVLHLEDGRHLPTPLRGYARGHEDPSGPRDVLSSATFTQLMNDLQRRVAAAA